MSQYIRYHLNNSRIVTFQLLRRICLISQASCCWISRISGGLRDPRLGWSDAIDVIVCNDLQGMILCRSFLRQINTLIIAGQWVSMLGENSNNSFNMEGFKSSVNWLKHFLNFYNCIPDLGKWYTALQHYERDS